MIQTTLEKINTFNFYGSLQVILISSCDFQFFPFLLTNHQQSLMITLCFIRSLWSSDLNPSASH